jgi:peptidoglycan/xylan/chitin deacetylase (PgdA/CDA1 family)
MLETAYSGVTDFSVLLHNMRILVWFVLLLLVAGYLIPGSYASAIGTRVRSFYRQMAKDRKKQIPKLFAAVLALQILLHLVIYQVDAETMVVPQEKLVIIEIDDFWNLEGGHFDRYGYSFSNYESVIGPIEEHGFKATLGASPYIFIEEEQDILALRDDEAMVSYLKEKRSKGHEIAMHGYAHCRNTTYCSDYEENYLNILQGKKEIDSLLGQDTVTYLPPGNLWEDLQYDNVRDTGFMITANTHVSKAYWDGDVLITQRGYDVISVMDWYGDRYEHYPYEDWVDAYEESDLFIMQLHCNSFDSREKLVDLERFLDFLEDEDVRVVTYREAYDILK